MPNVNFFGEEKLPPLQNFIFLAILEPNISSAVALDGDGRSISLSHKSSLLKIFATFMCNKMSHFETVLCDIRIRIYWDCLFTADFLESNWRGLVILLPIISNIYYIFSLINLLSLMMKLWKSCYFHRN